MRKAIASWRFWLGVAISLLFLALAFRGIHPSEVMRAIREADYLPLFPAALTILVVVGIKAVRWKLLFHPRSDLSLGHLYAVLAITYMLNNLFPARMGELARIYLLDRVAQTGWAHTLSTIVVERLLDVLTLLLFLALLVPFMPMPDWAVRSGWGIGIATVAAFSLLLAWAYREEEGLAILYRLLRALPWLDREPIRRGLRSFAHGLTVLKNGRVALGLILLSLMAWAVTALVNYQVMLAFDLRLPFSAPAFVLCVTTLAMLVPSSPGYVGVFDYLTVLSLTLFSVEKGLALSYALVLHALGYVVLTVLGIAFLWMEGYSLMGVRKLWETQTSGEHAHDDR